MKRMQAVFERLSAPFTRGSAPAGPRKSSERWLVERITVAPLQGTVTLNASVTVCKKRSLRWLDQGFFFLVLTFSLSVQKSGRLRL